MQLLLNLDYLLYELAESELATHSAKDDSELLEYSPKIFNLYIKPSMYLLAIFWDCLIPVLCSHFIVVASLMDKYSRVILLPSYTRARNLLYM